VFLISTNRAGTPAHIAMSATQTASAGTQTTVAADEINAAAVSRMLIGSRAIPLALVRDGKFAFANAGFSALFGAAADMVGMAVVDLIGAEGRSAMTEALSKPAECPAAFRGRAIRRDGTSFQVELSLTQETLDGVATICVFGQDVTDRQISECPSGKAPSLSNGLELRP